MAVPQADVLQPGTAPVDAISLLRVDSDAIDGLVAKYWDVSHADAPEERAGRGELAMEVCRRVRDYLRLELAFVRSVAGAVADAPLLREMGAGQRKALELVAAIELTEPADTQHDAAVRVLGDFLLHHASGEREGVFRHVAASRMNLIQLGEQLRQQRARGFRTH